MIKNLHTLLILALMTGAPQIALAMEEDSQAKRQEDLAYLYELSLGTIGGAQPQTELFKILAELDLPKTELREVPESIGTMKELRRISLENNGLRNLPESLGKLSKLKKINLGHNLFEEFPSVVTELPKLEDLALDRNKLTTIPDKVGTMKKMRRLKLARNKIGHLPQTFENLSGLHELDVSNNRLTDFPDLSKAQRLRKLNLMQNPVNQGYNAQGAPVSACSTAMALYRIVGKNCIHAAHKLHTLLNDTQSHEYLRTVLADLFARVKDPKSTFSLALIPQELTNNPRFCAHLKQAMAKKKALIQEQKDPALGALKELHKHLHYYTWLDALSNSQKAFCTSPFYTDPFKGLPESLQLMIWSMIHDDESKDHTGK